MNRSFALQVGNKYFCGDEDGYTRLGESDDKDIWTFSDFFTALSVGKNTFDDPNCLKFKVVPLEEK